MAERKPEWPEVGDLIIAGIEKVADYGAYAKYDDFDDEPGLLQILEISSSRIGDIQILCKTCTFRRGK